MHIARAMCFSDIIDCKLLFLSFAKHFIGSLAVGVNYFCNARNNHSRNSSFSQCCFKSNLDYRLMKKKCSLSRSENSFVKF